MALVLLNAIKSESLYLLDKPSSCTLPCKVIVVPLTVAIWPDPAPLSCAHVNKNLV